MLRRICCFLLSAALLVGIVTGCGQTGKPGQTETKPDTKSETVGVEIVMPYAEGVRAVVQGEAATTVQAYLVARAYIAKLAEMDLETFDAAEFVELVQKASDTLDIAEALAASLSDHCDALIAMEEAGEPTIGPAVMREISHARPVPHSLIPRAYAAEKNDSVKWAEHITETFDKAPFGKKLQSIADDMGTDVKHAKAALEMAQNILSGEAHIEQADFENKCYQTAVGVKAGATAAGFVVACVAAAPAAAAAGAAAATGGAAVSSAVTFGGVVCSGVNTVLDVNDAAIIIATDGEGNETSEAIEKTSSQFAPVSAAFALAGAAVNVKNLSDAARGKEVLFDGTKITTAAEKTKAIFENSVNLGLFVVPEAVSEYNDGSALGGTFTRDDTGWHFTLWETLTGASEEGQSGGQTQPEQTDAPETPFPADQVIAQFDGFTDPDEPFATWEYIAWLDEMMAEALGEEPADETEPEAGETGGSVGEADYDVSGTYTMVLNSESGASDTVTAEVELRSDNTMSIDFGLHKSVLGDDYSMTVDMTQIGEYIHLTGSYNPETMTFWGTGAGRGDDFVSASFFDMYDTVITFDRSGSATGTNAEGMEILGMDICTYITMTRVGKSDYPTAAEIAGTYVFAITDPTTGEGGSLTCIYVKTGEQQVSMQIAGSDAVYAGTYNLSNGLWSWVGEGQDASTWFTKDALGKIHGMFTVRSGETVVYEGPGDRA